MYVQYIHIVHGRDLQDYTRLGVLNTGKKHIIGLHQLKRTYGLAMLALDKAGG
jgi:hypothetical protein